MGEKRRYGNWDRAMLHDGERWPSKSYRRWGQRSHANAWKIEEGSSKPESSRSGDCHPIVPSWLRTFYTSVCRVPWRKICDARRMLSIYKNVSEWDDSAGQQEFENAKVRYWAKINGLPCELPLPDPDMYIEKVNFDDFIDPELIADLERCTFNLDMDKEAVTNHLDTVAHEPLPITGWGEAERSSANWDKYIEKPSSRWDDEVAQRDPWESRRNQSTDVNGRDSSWKPRVSWKDQENPWKREENWKQDRSNSGWNCMSSKYRMADDQTNSCWKNNNSFQKKVQPQRTWQRSEFMGSRNHQRTGYSCAAWQRENQYPSILKLEDLVYR